MTLRDNATLVTQGYILSVCTAIMIVLALVVLGAAVGKWVSVLSNGTQPATSES